MNHVRPPAHDFYIEIAERWFNEGHSPERWLAFNWDFLMLGGIFEVTYPSGELDDWMQSVSMLLAEHRGKSVQFQRQHLSWRERRRLAQAVKAYNQKEGFV